MQFFLPFLRALGLLFILSNSSYKDTLASHTADKNYSPEIQEIVEKGKLVVAILHSDNPPFFMTLANGELGGIDVELGERLAKELGVALEVNRTARTYDEVVNLVATNKADIGISKLSYTDERAKKVIYTNPYAFLRKAMLINRLVYADIKRSRTAESLTQLFSKNDSKIGVVKKSSYVDFARNLFPKASIIEIDSWENQAIKWLLQGKILALFRDEIETRKFLLVHPDANLKLLSLVLKDQEDSIRMVVPKNKLHLLLWINGFLETNQIKYNADMILEKNEKYLQKLK